MTATEILDACTHGNLADPERTVSLPCRACADRAVEAARGELLAVLRDVDAQCDHTDACARAKEWATDSTECTCCMAEVERVLNARRSP